MDNGSPLKLPPNSSMLIQFMAADINDYMVPIRPTGAMPEEGASFSLDEKQGLVPNKKYKILISANDSPGQKKDLFNFAFLNEDSTPFHYTVTDKESQEIEIDLGKKTVTAK